MTTGFPVGLPLCLSGASVAAIVAHARQEAPRECCGVITGRSGTATTVRPLRNVHPEPITRYDIDPQQLFDLEFKILPEAEEQIVVIYHSHPATEAWPSATDRAQAFWPDALYLICSLAEPDRPVLRAFDLSGPDVREVALEVS